MIKRYTRLALFKSKNAPPEANSKDYYYDMVANTEGDKNDKAYTAKFWLKQADSGFMYLSGETKKPYTNDVGATFDGYVLVSIKELDALEKEAMFSREKALSASEVRGQGMADVAREFNNGEATDVPF